MSHEHTKTVFHAKELKEIEVDLEKVSQAVNYIADCFEENEFDELTAYIAMIHLTRAMEEEFGFGHHPKADQ